MSPEQAHTATEIIASVTTGDSNPAEYAETALTAARANGARLNTFITLCDDSARQQAQGIDKENGLLAGVPVAIKDNICYRGYPTTCGSKILENFVPPYNATVVDRLLTSGAVIIGKTNMDEFAMGSSSETSFFGPARHPAHAELVPGGSSGGSAAAVAAGIVPVALGSDTGGSVRQPAAFCGILGLRPTYGAMSRYGLVAFASSFDQIGPLARNTEDLALAFQVIAGHDSRDATSADWTPPDYLTRLQPESPLTIGVPREFFGDGLDPEIDAWIKRSLHDLQEIGHRLVDVSLPLTDKAVATYYIIAGAEASSNLARYDGIRYGHRAEGETDLLEMYQRTRAEGFGREVKRRIMLGTYALSSGYYDEYYIKATKVRELIRREYSRVFEEVDALISPTTPTPAFAVGEKLDNPMAMYLSDVYTVSASLAGIPALSVPFGRTSDDLPVGIQFMANRFNELVLFQLAHALEHLG